MSWLVPSRHSSTVSPVKRGPLADMFSSTAHMKLLFSTTTLCAATVEKASASHPLRFGSPASPIITRKWLILTSWVFTSIPPRRMVMPGDGAVWPAMVTNGSSMTRPDFSRSIAPPTSNTMMRGPFMASAAARLPGPSFASVVTLRILPPLPPSVGSPGCAIEGTLVAARIRVAAAKPLK